MSTEQDSNKWTLMEKGDIKEHTDCQQCCYCNTQDHPCLDDDGTNHHYQPKEESPLNLFPDIRCDEPKEIKFNIMTFRWTDEEREAATYFLSLSPEELAKQPVKVQAKVKDIRETCLLKTSKAIV